MPDEKLKTAQTEPQSRTVQPKKKNTQKRKGINSPEKKHQGKQTPSSQILHTLWISTAKKQIKRKALQISEEIKELFIDMDEKESSFVLLGQIKQRE